MKKSFRYFMLLAACLILAVMAAHCRATGRIHPTALTGFALQTCEELERDVLQGVAEQQTEAALSQEYFKQVQNTAAYKGSYITLDFKRQRVLDGWGTPLNVATKEFLVTNSFAAKATFNKTNQIILWSSGPNRRNEFGEGDDMVLLPSTDK